MTTDNAAGELELTGKRFVLIEDESLIVVPVYQRLTQAGMHCAGMAVSGEEGVALALHERPDLVLLDIKLVGMDGMEAARRILAAYRPCVLFFTGYVDDAHRREAEQLGACGYIIKPITGEKLLEAVRSAFYSGKEGADSDASQ